MKKINRLISTTLFILMLTALFVFSSSAAQTYQVRMATYFGSDHAASIALREVFKPKVEERTNGNVVINIFDNCQLGAEVEFTENLRAGTIEMAIFGNMLENTLQTLKILQQPFIFDGPDHLLKVLNGPVGEKLLSDFATVGVTPLSGFTQGEVHLANNKRTIRTLEDAKGLRMRVWEGESIIKTMKAIGISPIAMALTETYTALQQGIVDGVPNSILNFENMGWGDQLKYISKMTLMVFPNYYVANKAWFDKLPEEYQLAIRESAIESAEYTMKIMAQKEAETEAYLADNFGATIITLTDEEKEPFRQATKVVLDEFSGQNPWAAELFEDIASAK